MRKVAPEDPWLVGAEARTAIKIGKSSSIALHQGLQQAAASTQLAKGGLDDFV